MLPLDLIGITSALLLLVLCSAKLAELALRVRSGERERLRVPEALPRLAPRRAMAIAPTAGMGWVAVFADGVSAPLLQPQPREPMATGDPTGRSPHPPAGDRAFGAERVLRPTRATAHVDRMAVAICDRDGEGRGQRWVGRTTIADPDGGLMVEPEKELDWHD